MSDQNDEIIQHLITYGAHLGNAFQIADDILDYIGNAEEMGKNVGDDLAEGKPTLPLLYAMWHGTEQQKTLIKEAIETGNGLQHFTEIMSAMEQTGALDYTKNLAIDASEKAIEALETVPDSDYKTALIGLARIAVERAA